MCERIYLYRSYPSINKTITDIAKTDWRSDEMPTSKEGYGWIKPEMLTAEQKEEMLTSLVKEYEEKRDLIDLLQKDVASVKWHMDQLREYDKNYVWCHKCNMRHRIGSQLSYSRKHQCVKIPKRCLSKYDHIFKYQIGRAHV